MKTPMRWISKCGSLVCSLVLAPAAMAAEPAGLELDGKPIEPGTTVDVPAGAVKNLTLPGGTRAVLLPGSSVIVAGQQWYPAESEKGPKSVKGSRLYIKAGEVAVSVPENAAAPTALAIIGGGGQTMLVWRGTTRVTADHSDMAVAVDDGAAYVGAEDHWVRMSARSAALIPKKTAPQVFKGRVAAPDAVACNEGGVGLAYDANKAPVNVCWKPVAGAAGYRVELARDEAMTQVVETFDVASPAAAKAELKLAPGTYYSRVVAVGPEHMPSPASAARSVVVTRASLAGGAVVMNDGAILMAKDSSVSLDTTGLKVVSAGGHDLASALANAVVRTPATAPSNVFTLDGHRARVVRMRDASGTELRLAFVQRELRARIEMPKNARWDNPLDVSVTLEDPGKRLDLASEAVKLEVTVDGKSIPATWTRSGDTFRARLAPIDAPGPFLVRVSAKDSSGTEIGGHIVDLDGRRSLDEVSKGRRIANR